jgi:inner membrane protein involved in colicin E2 resistance
MFMLLRVQDVALLTRAIISFALIALTMYLTRNLSWYSGASQPKLRLEDAVNPPQKASL